MLYILTDDLFFSKKISHKVQHSHKERLPADAESLLSWLDNFNKIANYLASLPSEPSTFTIL